MRTAFAILCACVLLTLSLFVTSASAGDYYNGYGGPRYNGYHGNVWYSSSCCYKKVVRHTSSVHFVYKDPYYRNGYYDRPYRNGYYDRPYRYVDYGLPRYNGHYNGYNGYGAYNAAYADGCRAKRVAVGDGRGGWVWGAREVCN